MMDYYLKLCTVFLPIPRNGYVATCTFYLYWEIANLSEALKMEEFNGC